MARASSIPSSVAAAGLWCLRIARKFRPVEGLFVFGLSSAAIMMATGFYGPLVMVPVLAAANVIAFNLAIVRRYRAHVFAIGCLVFLLPALAEWVGQHLQAFVAAGESHVVVGIYQSIGLAIVVEVNARCSVSNIVADYNRPVAGGDAVEAGKGINLRHNLLGGHHLPPKRSPKRRRCALRPCPNKKIGCDRCWS